MKHLAIVFLSLIASQLSFGQYSLVFCEDVDANGVPKMPATTFMVSERGGMLRFCIRGDEALNPEGLKYQVFLINEAGNEEQVAEFKQSIESGWNYAWKDVVFFDPGAYRVKVYDAKEDYLTSANVNIKKR